MQGTFQRLALVLAIMMLVACGSGGGSETNSTTTSSSLTNRNDGGGFIVQSQTLTVLPVGTWTMLADSSVLVPAGTTVTAPDGSSTITITSRNGIIYTGTGATVTVPADAVGPALNTVTTSPAPNTNG